MHNAKTTFATNVPPPWTPVIIKLPCRLRPTHLLWNAKQRAKLLNTLSRGGFHKIEDLQLAVDLPKQLTERLLGSLVKAGHVEKIRKWDGKRHRYLYSATVGFLQAAALNRLSESSLPATSPNR